MPFLDRLRKESLDFTNIYSEAPYTEAALVSLLCGMDTLKGGGYLKKLKGKEKNYFKKTHKLGSDGGKEQLSGGTFSRSLTVRQLGSGSLCLESQLPSPWLLEVAVPEEG